MSSKDVISVGIIGCGLIGGKRAASLGKYGKLIACADVDLERAKALGRKFDATPYSNWRDLLSDKAIDAVIISTLHDSLVEIACEAMHADKHVLIEKPGARNAKEFQKIIETQRLTEKFVHVGFNHRYHRAIIKAKELVKGESIGDLMFIRARYGHGARVGYEKEWRANQDLSGGGELIDQGPHLIDLASWFLGKFTDIQGFADTFYWDMKVDDNAFLMLRTAEKKTAFLHVSCTEWKNLFSFEIYGKGGKIEVNGLGGSYGVEKITLYKMLPEMGPPETLSWEYPMPDNSWEVEFQEFCMGICGLQSESFNLESTNETLEIIQKIYIGHLN